ncbi:MAG: helix-turn-helix domain-containing protein [Bilophila wadsworthia]
MPTPARRGLWAKWPGASASAQAGCTRCPAPNGALSPQAWLAERRIGHVRKGLAESDLPIADLALRAGYADQSALTRAMQRLTGLTPAAYRRQTRLEQKNRSPEQDSRTRP